MKVYQNAWDLKQGEYISSYIHNPAKEFPHLGKIGSVIKLQTEDSSKVEPVMALASTLSMHIAAMKPNYLQSSDVPKEVRDRAYDIGKGEAVKKMYAQEVLFD